MDSPITPPVTSPPLSNAEEASPRHAPLGLGAFVVLCAMLMALNALSVDIMLPAFPDIGRDMGGLPVTQVQAVITSYLLGFGVSQLLIGFISDRYGRRRVLLTGLVLFVLASALVTVAGSFTALLTARFLQGLASGVPRVIATAALRDCYSGRRLARVTSLVMSVFMAAPVLAPMLGQGILLVSDWRMTLGVLVLYALLMLALCYWRFPETLPEANRRGIGFAAIRAAGASLLGSRVTVGYTLAAAFYLGALFGYIGMAQAILGEHYGLGGWFTVVFAGTALAMSASSFVNAALVERYGTRLLSHGAIVVFIALSAVMLALSLAGMLGVVAFVILQVGNILLVGLVFSNFNALAMEPQGHIAGVAASFMGAVTAVVGAGLGNLIAQRYDNSATPMAEAFVVCGCISLALAAWADGGHLFGRGRDARM